jgi:hypothetical protein
MMREQLLGMSSRGSLAQFTRSCHALISDFGGVFSELDLGNKWAGQFFTPAPVCRMMAAMTFDSSAREIIETRGYPGRVRTLRRWRCHGYRACPRTALTGHQLLAPSSHHRRRH